jgi:HEAT repeat protein
VGSTDAADATLRAVRAAAASDWERLAADATGDPDARVRAVAISSLVQRSPRAVSAPVWRRVAGDQSAQVRRRAAEVAPALGRAVPNRALVALLGDGDAWVAEAAAFAIGEHPRPTRGAIDALAAAARDHADALVREAAVAALGAIGDPATLPVVLHACDDKPAIRRRAVLALAAFEGDEVEERLRAARTDRDWQVRQAAEDLLR